MSSKSSSSKHPATKATFEEYKKKQREIANMKDDQIDEIRKVHPGYANITPQQFKEMRDKMKKQTDDELRKTFDNLQAQAKRLEAHRAKMRESIAAQKKSFKNLTFENLKKHPNPAYRGLSKEQFDQMKKDMAESSVEDLLMRAERAQISLQQRRVAMAAKFKQEMAAMSPDEVAKLKEQMKNMTPEQLKAMGGGFESASQAQLDQLATKMGKIDLDQWVVPQSEEKKEDANSDEPPALE